MKNYKIYAKDSSGVLAVFWVRANSMDEAYAKLSSSEWADDVIRMEI